MDFSANTAGGLRLIEKSMADGTIIDGREVGVPDRPSIIGHPGASLSSLAKFPRRHDRGSAVPEQVNRPELSGPASVPIPLPCPFPSLALSQIIGETL